MIQLRLSIDGSARTGIQRRPFDNGIWTDGERLIDTVGGEKGDTVKFAWPKANASVSRLVDGYHEFNSGARAWGASATGFDVYYDGIAIGTSRIGRVK